MAVSSTHNSLIYELMRSAGTVLCSRSIGAEAVGNFFLSAVGKELYLCVAFQWIQTTDTDIR